MRNRHNRMPADQPAIRMHPAHQAPQYQAKALPLPYRIPCMACRVLLPTVFLLTACMGRPMPDANVPPFAKLPFQKFSRQAVVAIALREWRLFGQTVPDPDAEAQR